MRPLHRRSIGLMRVASRRAVSNAVGVALRIAAMTVSVGACARSMASARPEAARSEPVASSYAVQFDSLWSRFDAVYPSFDYKRVDWKAQRTRYRTRAQNARSQAEFIAIAREMLEPLRDLHVWFVDPRGQVVPTYRPPHVANFDAVRWERAMRDASYVQRAEGLGEAIVGGFGYLYINSWSGPSDLMALDLAMARLRDMPGLIIDLRTNGGGSDATALALASRFTSRSFVASYVQVRNGPHHEDLAAPVARTVAPRGVWQYLRPVVLLTGRGGFSATESFVAAMRTLPNVTVIGDTTGGASGNPATFSLGNGWSYTVPQWFELGPDRQPIEGRGVAPHVALPWMPSLYERDRDPLIDAAVGLLGEINGMFRVAPSGAEPAARPITFGGLDTTATTAAHRPPTLR